MNAPQTKGFPVGFETGIIIDDVKKDERVVYMNSCACLPLYRELLKVTRENNIRTTTGTHESIDVEDDWATLIIGQCVLDEFADVSKAVSEISRVLKHGGRIILTGPVSYSDELRFERVGKPPAIIPSLREIETELLRHALKIENVYNLTSEARAELRRSGGTSRVLDFDPAVNYVLVKIRKVANKSHTSDENTRDC